MQQSVGGLRHQKCKHRIFFIGFVFFGFSFWNVEIGFAVITLKSVSDKEGNGGCNCRVSSMLLFFSDNLIGVNRLIFSSWKMEERWRTDTTQYAAAAGVQLLYGTPPVAFKDHQTTSQNKQMMQKLLINVKRTFCVHHFFYNTTLVYFTSFTFVITHL